MTAQDLAVEQSIPRHSFRDDFVESNVSSCRLSFRGVNRAKVGPSISVPEATLRRKKAHARLDSRCIVLLRQLQPTPDSLICASSFGFCLCVPSLVHAGALLRCNIREQRPDLTLRLPTVDHHRLSLFLCNHHGSQHQPCLYSQANQASPSRHRCQTSKSALQSQVLVHLCYGSL